MRVCAPSGISFTRNASALVVLHGDCRKGERLGMAGGSRATAFREISNLLARGLLVRRAGGGRSVSYELRWEDLSP